jgi:MoaA/NifB/PqqE/SkfB family radical SAM enzyme
MRPLDRAFEKAMELCYPLTVHLDLTYRCHQRCVHCYLPEAWRRGNGPGPEMDTRQIKGILDQLAAAGTFFITFSGGEIFLRADLFTILQHARKLNFTLSLMTSGALGPDKEQARELANLGVQAILVSLHGLSASLHDPITGVPGSCKRVRRTIENCRRQGLLVVLNSQAVASNYRHLRALKEHASREGLTLRMDDNLTPRWDGRPHPHGLALNPEERAWLLQSISEAGGAEPATPGPNAEGGGCRAGLSLGYITPQGEVWPCLELPWPCGRLTGNGQFAQIWRQSTVLNWLRPLIKKDREVKEPFCVYLRRRRISPELSLN